FSSISERRLFLLGSAAAWRRRPSDRPAHYLRVVLPAHLAAATYRLVRPVSRALATSLRSFSAARTVGRASLFRVAGWCRPTNSRPRRMGDRPWACRRRLSMLLAAVRGFARLG